MKREKEEKKRRWKHIHTRTYILKGMTRFCSTTLVLLLLTLTTRTVHSGYSSISTGSELLAFAKEVNSGLDTYFGSTVTLANDIDLSDITDFPCIGKFDSNIPGLDFRGVFEGNGHLIKNMNFSSSDVLYAGLFGYTNGCTIRNVVIDSSCTITNNNSTGGHAGGIVGYANTGTGIGETNILNCVNMGTIAGSAPNSKVGGIAGCLFPSRYPASIVNCANLGDVLFTGTTATEAYVGGIVGFMSSNHEQIPYIYNCVNMGTITPGISNLAGGIVGNSSKTTNVIQHNYWLSGTASACYNGDGSASDNEVFDSNYALSSGSSLVDVLNEYVSSSGLGFRNWHTVAFDTNGGSTMSSMTAMWVLLGTPKTPTKEEGAFTGWYTEPTLKIKWSSSTQFSSSTTLYAKWTMNQYTVKFNSAGGSEVPFVTSDYGSTITLSTPTRIGYTFNGWRDEDGTTYTSSYTINKGKNVTLTAQWTPNQYTVKFNTTDGSEVPSITSDYDSTISLSTPNKTGYTFNGWRDEDGITYTNSYTIKKAKIVTLTAQWSPIKYTVTFDFGNGTIVNESFIFNETINYPEDPVRERYEFIGWDNNITEMPAEDIIITALWEEIPTEYVEIVFNKRDMTEDEVRDFISKYAPNENYVIKIIKSKNNETTVIIKFSNAAEAKHFREAIERTQDTNNLIKRTSFVDREDADFFLSISVYSMFYYLTLFF